ncbi:MAG: DUF3365 domain-containing protein [Reichenbachiella sp.]
MKYSQALTFCLLLSVNVFNSGCEANRQEKTNRSTEAYLKIGQSHVADAQALLGSNLTKAMHTSGPLGALGFCNASAIKLTDSAASTLDIQIKRVSDKNRNPDNAANQEELNYILNAKANLANGKQVLPQLVESKDQITGYYPIMTNQLCLQCHGTEKTMDGGTIAMVNKFYPEDKAVGYNINELRGIWVVDMKKQ